MDASNIEDKLSDVFTQFADFNNISYEDDEKEESSNIRNIKEAIIKESKG